jgi:hypothetical protein
MPKHAIVARAGKQVDLLRAPDGGRRQVFVGARLELDVVLLDEALGLPQRLVEAAQGRAAIARNVARRIEPGSQVALALHHRQTDQGLGPGQIDPAAFEHVLVVEGHGQCHCGCNASDRMLRLAIGEGTSPEKRRFAMPNRRAGVGGVSSFRETTKRCDREARFAREREMGY